MKKIAFLGLGTMGGGMAANLQKAGHSLTVWNRDAKRTNSFVKNGANRASTPAEAVAGAEIIFYSFSNDQAVDDVVFGKDGILQGVEAGQIALNTTTVHPETSRKEARAFAEKKVEFLDTPVFGSKNEAADGKLWVLAGGDHKAFLKVKPLLEIIGETVHYMGENGQGSSMKLVGNLIVAAQLQALGEGLSLAVKAGLDLKDVLGVLKVTDFRSPILENTTEALMKRDFSPSFALKLMLKDANLISRFAQDLNVPIPASAAARETIKAAVNQGWGEENASALIKNLEQQAGVKIGEPAKKLAGKH
jgi:3-hydroxyisobutyrate dehydrogenase-like beta-hydroxyacid dehydrogenase